MPPTTITAEAVLNEQQDTPTFNVAPIRPSKPLFTVSLPQNTPALTVDCIKLTAQYVARNGREFLEGLRAREGKNDAFSFLFPGDRLNVYFEDLI